MGAAGISTALKVGFVGGFNPLDGEWARPGSTRRRVSWNCARVSIPSTGNGRGRAALKNAGASVFMFQSPRRGMGAAGIELAGMLFASLGFNPLVNRPGFSGDLVT